MSVSRRSYRLAYRAKGKQYISLETRSNQREGMAQGQGARELLSEAMISAHSASDLAECIKTPDLLPVISAEQYALHGCTCRQIAAHIPGCPNHDIL
jgi:hypothetical protein